jgi:hypothetical protein
MKKMRFIIRKLTDTTSKPEIHQLHTFCPKQLQRVQKGFSPDGKYVLIESDRHQPKELSNQYRLDVYKLKA